MYRSIVILTGAGISAESGIRTFRDGGGLWESFRIEDVATPEAFVRDPASVHRFYNERRRSLLDPALVPNPAHHALARLEQACSSGFLLVTQNIDDLHERSGSRAIVHMHGELLKVRCTASGRVCAARPEVSTNDGCDCCRPSRPLRPHVVWFGEMPLEMGRILERLRGCDLFVAIGTSGLVYPAAGFVEYAIEAGAHTIELNLEPSAVHSHFAERIYGPASQTVPALVERLLAG